MLGMASEMASYFEEMMAQQAEEEEAAEEAEMNDRDARRELAMRARAAKLMSAGGLRRQTEVKDGGKATKTAGSGRGQALATRDRDLDRERAERRDRDAAERRQVMP